MAKNDHNYYNHDFPLFSMIFHYFPLFPDSFPPGLGPATGPLTQATGPPRSGGGVAIGMLRGNPVLSAI